MDNEAKNKIAILKRKIRLAEADTQLTRLELMVETKQYAISYALVSAYQLGASHALDSAHGGAPAALDRKVMTPEDLSILRGETMSPPEPEVPSTVNLHAALKTVMKAEAVPSKVKISAWSPARKLEAMKWAKGSRAWSLGDYFDPDFPSDIKVAPIMPAFLRATGKKRPPAKKEP